MLTRKIDPVINWNFQRTQSENKIKRKDREILGSCQRVEKVKKHEGGCVISVVVGVLETDIKSLERILNKLKISGRMETIENKALLRSARILRKILEAYGY